jgi:hypothetical protein
MGSIPIRRHYDPNARLTVEQMEKLCPPCAAEMRRKHITSVKVSAIAEYLVRRQQPLK